MRFRRLLLVFSTALALALAGCGEEAQQEEAPADGNGEQAAEPENGAATEDTATTEDTAMQETTMMEDTAMEGTGEQGTLGAGQVTVGGFTVESPGVPAREVPEVQVSQEEAQQYLDEVRPIAEDTVRDVSDLVDPQVRVENGNVVLDLGEDNLREARDSVEEGAERLRQVDPPANLEPINEQLIDAYEQAQPAYEDIIRAAEGGDPGEISSAVQESLPQIEQFRSEVNAIIQDLEQAAGQAQ
jgi:hypothetical protein